MIPALVAAGKNTSVVAGRIKKRGDSMLSDFQAELLLLGKRIEEMGVSL